MATRTRELDLSSLDAPISPAEPPTSQEEVLTLNIGPHHPASERGPNPQFTLQQLCIAAKGIAARIGHALDS